MLICYEYECLLFCIELICFCFLGPTCDAKLELVFVIDGSSSIEHYGRGNFKRCLNFIKQVQSSFAISADKTRVGVVLFSSRARTVFSLDTYSDSIAIGTAIDKIRYPRGGTKLGRALQLVQNDVFRKARKAVPKVLIVMTDGRSADRVEAPAQRLKATGATLFAFGIGKRYDRKQLERMASDKKHLITRDFSAMAKAIKPMAQDVCRGNYLFIYSFI